MSTNADLADWEQELLQNCDEQLIRAAEHRAQELCQGCYGAGALRLWPLAPRRPVCDGCWLHLVRGDVHARPAGRRGLQVWTTHPQRGELLRGTVRAVGIEQRPLRPTTRWALADQDGTDLGEYVGDYVDAEARLLEATAWADEIDDNPSNDDEE